MHAHASARIGDAQTPPYPCRSFQNYGLSHEHLEREMPLETEALEHWLQPFMTFCDSAGSTACTVFGVGRALILILILILSACEAAYRLRYVTARKDFTDEPAYLLAAQSTNVLHSLPGRSSLAALQNGA